MNGRVGECGGSSSWGRSKAYGAGSDVSLYDSRSSSVRGTWSLGPVPQAPQQATSHSALAQPQGLYDSHSSSQPMWYGGRGGGELTLPATGAPGAVALPPGLGHVVPPDEISELFIF